MSLKFIEEYYADVVFIAFLAVKIESNLVTGDGNFHMVKRN